MTDIIVCKKCVLPSSYPRIKFNEEGICNFCTDQAAEKSEKEIVEQSRGEVAKILANKGGGEYDAIVCYSGGKDSTYTLMLAVRKYGLKVLAFTLDNGFISRTAFNNIHRTVDALGVDHITVRPAKPKIRAIIRASTLFPIYNPRTLLRISANCQSCISIVNITAIKLAYEKRAPVILAGFTLGQIPANAIYYKNNHRFLEESRKPILEKLRQHSGENIDDYFCISDKVLDSCKEAPYNINLLCLEDISEDEILAHVKELGWIPPKDVDGCSSNCRLNSFNNIVHMKSLGYNPYALELSHLIRSGLMSRDQALEKMADQRIEQHELIMSDLGISKLQFENLSNLYQKTD
jgi:tRNA(Ile)-lysidine synthase TilS/MesJ